MRGKYTNFRNVKTMLFNILMGIAVSGSFFKYTSKSIHARKTAKTPNCHAKLSKQKHPSACPAVANVNVLKINNNSI